MCHGEKEFGTDPEGITLILEIHELPYITVKGTLSKTSLIHLAFQPFNRTGSLAGPYLILLD